MGDILTLVGGTFTVAATFTVTTINAETGSVTGVSLANGGNYSVFPAAGPVPTTGGQGTGCTLTVTTAGTAVTGGTVTAGGSPWPRGYRVGDVCQLEGGIFTAAASVVVTATTSGQVAGVEIRTAGSGYTVNPCIPTPCFGGHGCGLKVTATFVGGVMTAVAVADMGGSCWEEPKKFWQVTDINIFPNGSGPPALPRSTVCGKMLNQDEKDWDGLHDFCAGMTNRPVTKFWLPTGSDVNATCCAVEGDVIEAPAKSNRLYNVQYVEYLDLDCCCRCSGTCCCPGERLKVVASQQCPFGVFPEPPQGDWLVSDDGAFILTSDPWHYLTPEP